MKMKSMEELANGSQVNESLAYDEIIRKLNEAKENGTPLDEGLIGAIGGAILGASIGPKLGGALCKALGVERKGRLGSLLTAKLVLGAIGAARGWKI